MSILHEGGCRCGAARYEIDLTGAHTLNCHCRDCQKHLGAPFSVFTIVEAPQFRWLTPPTGSIALSNSAVRRFCVTCGTYLKWEGADTPDKAEINVMTLDAPEVVKVDEEIYVGTRLDWIKPLDGIPQYTAGRGG